MSVYKVIKDFPSRNGVRQYKTDQMVSLDANSRTKALLEMGYIIEKCDESSLPHKIVRALSTIKGVKNATISSAGKGRLREAFMVVIEEEK